MKSKILGWMLFLVVLCIFFIDATAQPTAVINYIDASGYPKIRAGYTYMDVGGNVVRPPNYIWRPEDIIINENGKVRPHNDGSPSTPPSNNKSFSVILVFDISLSMVYGMDGSGNVPAGQQKYRIALSAMEHFVEILDSQLTECAIIEFDNTARLILGWTKDKESLLKVVRKQPNIRYNYANYNSAFLHNKIVINNNITYDSTNSALYVAKYANYKPVIIFLTDGNHKTGFGDTSVFDVAAAYTLAKQRNVYVFIVKIGNEALDPLSTSNLNIMAGVEGNISDNIALDVTNPDSLNGFYDKILQICGQIGYPAPCEVEWESECSGGGSLDLTFPNHGNLTASSSFTIPNSVKPYLEFTPNSVSFRCFDLTNKDTTVTITAKNNFVYISSHGYSTTDSLYYTIDWGAKGNPPFRLEKDSSVTLTIRYNPTNLCYSSSQISIEGTMCSGELINIEANKSDEIKPYLEIYPNSISFNNIDYSTYSEDTVQLFAKNNYVEIHTPFGFETTDNRYIISNWGIKGNPPFILEKDSSTFVTVRYTPLDSCYSSANIQFKSSACNINSIKAESMKDLISKDINMGDTTVFSSKDVLINDLFCNTVSHPINISSLEIESGDAVMFSCLDLFNPQFLDTCECLKITFRFTPLSEGLKSSKIILSTSAGNYISNIFGRGININSIDDFNNKNPIARIESINPNPSMGRAEVKYFLAERVLTKIWITNILGNRLLELENRIVNSGENSVYFNVNSLSDGVYFIIMQTPTQIFKKRFNIIK